MDEKPQQFASVRSPSPALALRDACRRAGCDDHGVRCDTCAIKDLCESEARWLVPLTTMH
jgi:hypothetical protein